VIHKFLWNAKIRKVKILKTIFFIVIFQIFLGCSSTSEGETITYNCKQGHKISCIKKECEEKCRKYSAYDDPNIIKRKSDSDNPFILDDTEEQVEFGHGN
jgi:hypothetical protein